MCRLVSIVDNKSFNSCIKKYHLMKTINISIARWWWWWCCSCYYYYEWKLQVNSYESSILEMTVNGAVKHS